MRRQNITFVSFLVIICLSGPAFLFADSSTESSPVVRCVTTKGDIDIELYPDWSPLGAKRFIELVIDGFFTDIGLFRCVKRFLTQFGISDKPQYQHWRNDNIPDDPNLHLGIKKYYVSFAGGGPNTRSTQLFIAFEDLDFLGKSPWETPFGKVIRGMEVVDSWYTGYGDMKGFTKTGVDQQLVYQQGNKYLHANFPKLDYILSCQLLVHPPQQQQQQQHHQQQQEISQEVVDKTNIEETTNENQKDKIKTVISDIDKETALLQKQTIDTMSQALDQIANEAGKAVEEIPTEEKIGGSNEEALQLQQQFQNHLEQQQNGLIDKEKLLLHEGLDNLLHHQVEPLFSHRGKPLLPRKPVHPKQQQQQQQEKPQEEEIKYSLRSSAKSVDVNNGHKSNNDNNASRQFFIDLFNNSLFRYAALILLCGSVVVSVYLYRQSEKLSSSKYN